MIKPVAGGSSCTGPSLSSSSGCASSLSSPQCDHFVGCKICWAVRAVSCVNGQLHAMFFPSLLMPSVLSMHRVHLHLCAVCSLACDVIHSSCDVHADDHILVNYIYTLYPVLQQIQTPHKYTATYMIHTASSISMSSFCHNHP